MLELTPFPSIFPVETEENFIDQLSDCVPALRYCALTCRAWLPRSRFHLLRSVRIKSEKHLEAFSDMLDKYPTRRSWITSVTMAPTAKGSNPRRLLEVFSSVLLANTPNLERWEINQAGTRTVARRATLFFHKTTFIRLRCSSLKELHLRSIQLGSHAELIRLLVAFARLNSLKCTDVGFPRAVTPDLHSLKVAARRRLRFAELSTLTVQDMAPDVISLLLEIVQDVLVNLHMFHIKGTKLDAIPLPKLDSLSLELTKLSLITLNWRNKSAVTFKYSLPMFFRGASGLTADQLRWAPNLQSIAIQLHDVSSSEHQSHQPHAASLRRTLTSEPMKGAYLGLRRGLADLGLKKNLITLYLPSGWGRSVSSMLRGYLEKDSDELSRKGLLAIKVDGGTGLDPTGGYGHGMPVIALTVSPDGNWIATGSRDHYVVLWDTKHPTEVAKEWKGSANSSASLSFSPDSHRLAFPSANATDTIHWQIEPIGARDGRSAELHMPNVGTWFRSPPLSRHCAWSPDGTKLSAVVFGAPLRCDFGPLSAYVWDATTYTLLHTIDATDDFGQLMYQPLLNCFLDGRLLVVVWFPLEHYSEGWDAVPSPMSRSERTHAEPPSVWDLATGTRCATMPEEWGLKFFCAVKPSPDQRRITTICGADLCDWECYEFQWPNLRGRQTFTLSPNAQQRLWWDDSRFDIWDTRSDQCTASFRCATNVVGGCFSPDGQCVAICSEDGTEGQLQVGRVSDGVLLGSFGYECLSQHRSQSRDKPVVAFSGDGRFVYLGASTGDVHMFPLPLLEPNATHDDRTMRWQRCDDED